MIGLGTVRESCVNIGIDIDGTISAAPEFFAVLTKAFRQAGHKVYIVTYRAPMSVQSTRRELTDWGIEYDDMHLCGNGEDMGQWKAKIATMLDLDVMFDDMPQSLCRLPAEITRFWQCDSRVYDLEQISRGPVQSPKEKKDGQVIRFKWLENVKRWLGIGSRDVGRRGD